MSKDLTGKTFNRLTVLNRAPNNKHGHIRWNCLCICGNKSSVSSWQLINERTRSCGCLQREYARSKKSHGMAGSIEHRIWLGMKSRCYYKKNIRYHRYGGRGITVCDRWLDSFENFFDDMGEKTSDKHSIDRRDNDGNYEPSNCRWATVKQQAENKGMRSDNKSGVTGVYKLHGGYWKSSICVDGRTKHLYFGTNFSEACRYRNMAENFRMKGEGLSNCVLF